MVTTVVGNVYEKPIDKRRCRFKAAVSSILRPRKTSLAFPKHPQNPISLPLAIITLSKCLVTLLEDAKTHEPHRHIFVDFRGAAMSNLILDIPKYHGRQYARIECSLEKFDRGSGRLLSRVCGNFVHRLSWLIARLSSFFHNCWVIVLRLPANAIYSVTMPI